MGQFADKFRRFSVNVQTDAQAVFAATAVHALHSIQFGSSITGAPGQLVDEGNLRNSWQLEFPSKESARISTNVVYAREMEDGTREGRALIQRSPTGGFHSVRLTIVGLQRILEHETERLR
jgi:hypothetical protein